jgi:D-serine deaminase-like pyridoxal phosphate-dependent protein
VSTSPAQGRQSQSADRHHLARRLSDAVAGLEDPATPMVVVDRDAFDANADDLARRASGTSIRVASKSLRIPELIGRALAQTGFSGVLSYSLREALWLVSGGVCNDVVLGYPTVDKVAVQRLLRDEKASTPDFASAGHTSGPSAPRCTTRRRCSGSRDTSSSGRASDWSG